MHQRRSSTESRVRSLTELFRYEPSTSLGLDIWALMRVAVIESGLEPDRCALVTLDEPNWTEEVAPDDRPVRILRKRGVILSEDGTAFSFIVVTGGGGNWVSWVDRISGWKELDPEERSDPSGRNSRAVTAPGEHAIGRRTLAQASAVDRRSVSIRSRTGSAGEAARAVPMSVLRLLHTDGAGCQRDVPGVLVGGRRARRPSCRRAVGWSQRILDLVRGEGELQDPRCEGGTAHAPRPSTDVGRVVSSPADPWFVLLSGWRRRPDPT